MKFGLAKKISLATVSLAVGGIILSALFTNLALTWNFNRYLDSVQKSKTINYGYTDGTLQCKYFLAGNTLCHHVCGADHKRKFVFMI